MHIEKRWSPKQSKLVGKIILSNFLELSLDKFEKYIEAIEKSPLFFKLRASGIVKNVSETKTFPAKSIKPDNVIAKIEQPVSDEKLRYKLESDYGVSVSKRSIGLYRKELGIPSL